MAQGDKTGWQKTALRWLVVSFIIILAPVYILTVILYATGFDTLRREVVASMTAQSRFYMDNLEGEIGRIRNLQYDLINDRDINQLAAIPQYMDRIEKVFGMLRIQKRLTAIKESSAFIESVTVYIPASERQISSVGVSEFDTEAYGRLRLAEAGREREIVYADNRLLLRAQYPSPGSSALKTTLYLISIEITKVQIGRTMERFVAGDGSVMAFTDDDAQVFVATGLAASGIEESSVQAAVTAASAPAREPMPSDVAGIGSGAGPDVGTVTRSIRLAGRPFLLVGQHSDSLHATIYKLTPEDVLFKRLRLFHGWFYILLGMALVVILLYSVSIYRFIHKPLSRLMDAFKHVERGDFDIHIDHSHDDEFRYIYTQFNEMAINLKNLIDQVYNQKILVQRAEMRQLQTQINPHFLYNSFFMLNAMIRTGDTENLESVTRKLGQYFCFITKNELDAVPLSQEVQHARVYAEIQELRFSNRLKVEFDELPEAFEGVRVPRLILQPLLENAFEHGLGKKTSFGFLRVEFMNEGDELAVIVTDDGAAIGDRELDGIRAVANGERSESEGTALANINERLRLRFGEGATLRFASLPAGGLSVSFRLRKDGY